MLVKARPLTLGLSFLLYTKLNLYVFCNLYTVTFRLGKWHHKLVFYPYYIVQMCKLRLEGFTDLFLSVFNDFISSLQGVERQIL